MNKTTKPRQVRIIAGKWRQTKLAVLDSADLRPTSDRVRETLFNWLQHLYATEFSQLTLVDAFAGTGALGFEAASRGAKQVIMLEIQPKLVKQLHSIKHKLVAENVQIQQGDTYLSLANFAPNSVDLVLLDPPYRNSDYTQLIQLALSIIHANGLIYVESANKLTTTQLDDLQVSLVKYSKVSQVHAHLIAPIVN